MLRLPGWGDEALTFGEYLYKLLSDRKTNISRLAAEAGIKNKTEIYRLFENRYSYDKARALTERILSVSEIGGREREALYSLMEEVKIKPGMRKALEILRRLYAPEAELPPAGRSAQRLLATLERFCGGRTGVYIGSNPDPDVSETLSKFMTENPSADISVTHAVNFNRREDMVAKELFAVLKLAPYDGYNACSARKSLMSGIVGLSEAADCRHVFRLTESGEYAESDVSGEYYEFARSHLGMLEGSAPLKDTKGNITDYSYNLSLFASVYTNASIRFEGCPCFGDLPFDIMYELLKDADYFGLPPDSEYIENIVGAAKLRSDEVAGSGAAQRYILSEDKLKRMLCERRPLDQMDVFRPLAAPELIRLLGCLNAGNNRFRFFKPGYSNRCAENIYTENFGLVIWDAARAYGKSHFNTIIKHPKALSVYKSFAQYCWEHLTLSEEESAALLAECIGNAGLI